METKMWLPERFCITALLAFFTSMISMHVRAGEIVIVQVADFSASRAQLGKAMRAGAEIVFNKANSENGVSGHKVKFITFDDGYDPKQTVSLLENVFKDLRPTLILGLVGTANTGAALKSGFLEKYQTALIGPYTGADVLRSDDTKRVFHIRASYSEEIDRLVHHYSQMRFAKIALIYENDAFGLSVRSAYQKAIAQYGIQQSVEIEITRGQTEMAERMREIKVQNPQGIIVGTAGTPTAAFVKAAGEADLRAFRYGLSVNDVTSILKMAGHQHARGFGQVQVMPDPTSGCKLQICRDFNADYKAFGDKSLTSSPSMMEGYVAARISLIALSKVKGKINSQSVYEALNTIGRIELGGLHFDFSNGKRAGSNYMDIGMIDRAGKMMY